MTTKSTPLTIIITLTALTLALTALPAFAQSESAYDPPGSNAGLGSNDDLVPPGLLDPSRFKVSHSMGFAAGGSRISDIKSQSVYSTMLQYKFNAPVVMSLNFDMPIHSTINPMSNFTTDNLTSLDYFRNMPIDASIAWMPKENLLFRLSVIKQPDAGGYYGSNYYGSSFYRPERFYRGW